MRRREIVEAVEKETFYIDENIKIYEYDKIVSGIKLLDEAVKKAKKLREYVETGVVRGLIARLEKYTLLEDIRFYYKAEWEKQDGDLNLSFNIYQPLGNGKHLDLLANSVIEKELFYTKDKERILSEVEKMTRLMEATKFILTETKKWLNEEVSLSEFGSPPEMTEEDLFKILKGETALNEIYSLEYKLRR